MAGYLNKACLIGTLGKDPEIRSFQSGDRVAHLSIATSESWKDKTTGEKREKVEWHRVSIFNDHLVKLAENHLKKGARVYLEGALQTRKYEKDGRDVYTTEVVLQKYKGEILILQFAKEGITEPEANRPAEATPALDDMNSEIPF